MHQSSSERGGNTYSLRKEMKHFEIHFILIFPIIRTRYDASPGDFDDVFLDFREEQ